MNFIISHTVFDYPNSTPTMAPVMVLVDSAEPRSGLLIRVSSMYAGYVVLKFGSNPYLNT